MIVMGARVVIPKALQGDLLRDLLKMHQGTTKLRQRARLSVFWPNMDAEIVNLAGACEECTSSLPSHPPEPLRPHEPASRPFEQIHADLCQLNGRHFLIQVDAFSGWPHVVYFPDAHISAKKVINAVRELFINVGVPVKYWSDGGPQFPAAEFKQFLKEWGVSLGVSSPHFPQSNGVAEAGVKSMKKLIAGSFTSGSFDVNKFGQSLLLFRNTAVSGGRSPAQVVFNRPMRDCLPAHRRSFAAEWQKDADVLEKRARRAKELRTEHFNRRAHPLPPLQVGNAVLIQHPISKCWSTPGVITEVGPNRDYLVKTPAGRVFRRNRRFLRRRVPVMPAAVTPPTVPATPAPAIPGQAVVPCPAPDPAPVNQGEEDPPPRRSARVPKPSSLYPPHTWSK
ncbi:uncharacterized protein K02A2.6 [Daphnia magna]|nr:uncharacterized protein K02A2.6 [Daphnia magna]